MKNMIHLKGNAYNRGKKYGEVCSDDIYEFVERTKYILAKIAKIDPKTACDKLIENTKFDEAAEKWTPDLLEEVKGISDGAEISFNEAFTIQCGDEIGWIFTETASDVFEHCSGLGINKNDQYPTYVGQNLDWYSALEGLECVLCIYDEENRVDVITPSNPGVIGTMGMNSHGIGITTNAMSGLLNTSLQGLPVNFILRKVLSCKTLKEARAFLTSIQHASAENYIVGDKESIVNFECSANKVTTYVPHKNSNWVCHTNHPLINDDTIFPIKSSRTSTTFDRFEYLYKRLNSCERNPSLKTIQYLLRSHEGPVCVHHNFAPMSGFTQASAIFELTDNPTMHLTFGPPCLTEYKTFKFENK